MSIKLGKLLLYVFLIFIAVVTVFPAVYAICASFMTNAELLVGGSFFPKSINFDNYVQVWELSNFKDYFLNTVFFALATVIGKVLVAAMTGFAFARYEFPGKKFLFGLLMSTMFVSLGSAGLYQTIEVAKFLHIHQTLMGVVIIHICGSNIGNIFLIRNYMRIIPKEMDEAAIIDGCSFYQMFFRVMLPLMKPILASIAILAFKGAWNEYLLPMLFTMTAPERATLAVGLVALRSSGDAAASWNLQAAAAVITMLPILIIYFIFSKYFMGGVTNGAVKG